MISDIIEELDFIYDKELNKAFYEIFGFCPVSVLKDIIDFRGENLNE